MPPGLPAHRPAAASVLGLLVPLLLLPVEARALPDLTGTVDIVVNPPAGDPPECKIDWEVTLINIGDAQCPGNWWADFWLNYPCMPNEHPYVCNPVGGESWDSLTFGNIKPGQAKTFQGSASLPVNMLPYHYMLFADSIFNGCKEGDENNNLVSDEFFCLADPADLTVSCELAVDPENSDGVLFTATVTNQGKTPTDLPVFVDVFMDRLSEKCEDHFEPLPDGVLPSAFGTIATGLPPGESETIIIPVPLVEAGPHKPLCVVDGDKAVKEKTYANNCHSLQQFVMPENADKPDLLVEGCGIALEGNIPVYQGAILNKGFTDVLTGEQHKLCIYFDSPDKPGLGEVPDVMAGEGLVLSYEQPLPVDGEIKFAKSGPPLQNGYYKAWFRSDCDSEIFEMDEKNNDCTADVMVDLPGPDLYCKEISWVQEEESDLALVRYSVSVSNKGSDPSFPFDVDLFFDAPEAPTWDNAGEFEGLLEQFPENLDPDAIAPIEFVWQPPEGIPPGTYKSWVVLDIAGMLNKYETNTKNNICGPIEVVVEPIIAGRPNLEITTFTAKPKTGIQYSVVVSNTGPKPVKGKFRVDLFRDREKQPMVGDIGDYYQVVDGLESGATWEWNPLWENPDNGEYHAYVYVDVESVIEESFEGDNVAGPRISVICHDCEQCEEGVYLSAPCFCGDESVQYGFCCGGEWFAVGCPDLAEPVETVEGEFDASTVEFDTPGFKGKSPTCGCRVGHAPGLPSATPLLLALAAAFFLVLRRRRIPGAK
jgi:MYXO-CTERM domain-containing protein